MASSDLPAAQTQPSAQVIGNAFVNQYFHVLHESPESVHRFYHESSKLSRPDANGCLDTVTTTQAINEKILEMTDYSEFKAEINTVDIQESFNNGVIVLVTGCIVGKDLTKKDFVQSFFLAPQETVFYVLNDIFRYVEKVDHQLENVSLTNGTIASDYNTPQNIEVEDQIQNPTLEDEENVEEVYNPPAKEEGSVIVEEVPLAKTINELPSDSQVVTASASPATVVNEEAPKMSYATIVKFMKENPAPFAVPAPVPTKPAPKQQQKRSYVAPVAAQIPFTNGGSNVTENNVTQEAEDGYSIYVKSLPLSATHAQLEEEFRRFGPIKPGGIQVRSHKMQGFCFGFVEFESSSAVQSAIEASPVMIDGHKVIVEEKRANSKRGNSRGRLTSGRGEGPRSDGVRGRGQGGYGNGRSYGRGDQNNRGSFGNRGGGVGGRGGFPDRAGVTGPTSGRGSHATPQASTTA